MRRFAALLATATIGAAGTNTAARAADTIPNVHRLFELEDVYGGNVADIRVTDSRRDAHPWTPGCKSFLVQGQSGDADERSVVLALTDGSHSRASRIGRRAGRRGARRAGRQSEDRPSSPRYAVS